MANQAEENARYRQMAAEALGKNRRVNIRISARDLEGMQARAPKKACPTKPSWPACCTNMPQGDWWKADKRLEFVYFAMN